MKFRSLISKENSLVPLVLLMVSCEEIPKEVEVTERRAICQYDDPTVFKSSYDPILGTQPLSWRRVKGTKFRMLNYAAGERTEIAVGQVNGGGILGNLNRWKGEFAQDARENSDGLETVEMFGGENAKGIQAKVVELKGVFQKKMSGMPVKLEGWAMTGVICDIGPEGLITIKMMGPEAEVAAEKENLINFAKSLRFNTLQKPSVRSMKNAEINISEEGGY